MVVQYVIEDVGCQGGPVVWDIWVEIWYGCDFCWPQLQLMACETSPGNCLSGVPIDPTPAGIKKVCGCDQ